MVLQILRYLKIVGLVDVHPQNMVTIAVEPCILMCPKMGGPAIDGWCIIEHPIETDELEVPPILGNLNGKNCD